MDDKLKPPFLHNHEHQSSNITLVNESSIEEASKQEAFSIFSKKEKYVIVMIASFTAFISPLSANIYLPALDAIQKDLQTTEQLVGLTITTYMIFQGLSPSLWGAFADSVGRRPAYITSILFYIGACAGLACSKNYAVLVTLRMLQSFGSSPAIAIGAGTIGDISTPAERGGYMGIYSMGTTLCLFAGPVLGGILTNYFGWRSIFWFLAIFASTIWLTLVFFLPETLRKLVGDGSGYANPTPYQYWKRRDIETPSKNNEPKRKIPIHPFRSFANLKEKDVFVVLAYMAFQYSGQYTVLTSLTDLFSDIYKLDSLQLGLCFLPHGIGAIIGSYISGLVLNWSFKRISKSLGLDSSQVKKGSMEPSFPIERARLGMTYYWGFLYDALLIGYGWALKYKLPLPVPLTLCFMMAVCNAFISNAVNTLLVDLFPKNSASIIASNNITRCLTAALTILSIPPLRQAVGIEWTFTVISGILFLTRGLVMIELKYGPKWRLERLSSEE